MVTIQIKKLTEDANIPTQATEFAAGYDLYSLEDYIIQPFERHLFKTGLSIAIPQGLYGRIAPRSGLAFKSGIDVLAGVIDADYRGDVGVILINFGNEPKEIKKGTAIAQIIFEYCTSAVFQSVKELSETKRNDGGFGHTDSYNRIGAITESRVDNTVGNTVGNSLVDMYLQTGGIPTKKKYSEEIKERNQ